MPKIDYSDIPASTPEQLASMRRLGRPPDGEQSKHMIAIRLEPALLSALRREAARREIGYQTLIQEILTDHIEHP